MARKNTLQAHERRTRALMTAPMAAFGVLLVALPLIYVLCTSLVTGGKFQFGMPLTLANYKALLREDYLKVFANSLQLAFFTTVISLLVGYPFGYCMARAPRKWKALLMMLVIIPFWTSALVRIYGWKILLQANGPVNGVLRSLGLIQKNIKFLGSYGSVLLAMVYCLISFMILPCHNAVDKMDFTLVEASRDLGASPVRAFLTVTLPLTMPGILAGCALAMWIQDMIKNRKRPKCNRYRGLLGTGVITAVGKNLRPPAGGFRWAGCPGSPSRRRRRSMRRFARCRRSATSGVARCCWMAPGSRRVWAWSRAPPWPRPSGSR